MTKVYVLYASMFGHTKVLAEAIAEGAESVEGAEVVLESVEDVNLEELKTADAIIWGSSGFFGTPHPKMATFLSKLGGMWATGDLRGKVGGVFATTSTQHMGIEQILRVLQLPMQHHGMIVVSNTGELTPERTLYGCPYGAAATIPVETSKDAPMNRPRPEEMELAKEYGALVTKTAARLK